jgi:hypothetical protein
VIGVFELVVFAESYTLARLIPTPPSPHSLNTIQVSRYGNCTVGVCSIVGCVLREVLQALFERLQSVAWMYSMVKTCILVQLGISVWYEASVLLVMLAG